MRNRMSFLQFGCWGHCSRLFDCRSRHLERANLQALQEASEKASHSDSSICHPVRPGTSSCFSLRIWCCPGTSRQSHRFDDLCKRSTLVWTTFLHFNSWSSACCSLRRGHGLGLSREFRPCRRFQWTCCLEQDSPQSNQIAAASTSSPNHGIANSMCFAIVAVAPIQSNWNLESSTSSTSTSSSSQRFAPPQWTAARFAHDHLGTWSLGPWMSWDRENAP